MLKAEGEGEMWYHQVLARVRHAYDTNCGIIPTENYSKKMCNLSRLEWDVNGASPGKTKPCNPNEKVTRMEKSHRITKV